MSDMTIRPPRLPVLALLNPREQTPIVLLTLALALTAGIAEVRSGLPLWMAAATVLAALLIPGVLKWRADLRRFGLTAMGLSALLAAQGFHTIEHITQWVQYHMLGWTARASTGLLSPANAEWVHFVWNWLVLLVVVALIRGGLRNGWAWLLLAWVCAHTFEHSYMLLRYLTVLGDLRQMGVSGVTAQGLPGILGLDGWLAKSEATSGTFLCTLPGLTTANRLDVHFWWNVGEMLLLLCAAHTYLRQQFGRAVPVAERRS